MENYILSQHAAIRCQQRGISYEVINTILRLGQKEYRGDSCFLVFVPKKKVKELKLSEKIIGIAIIISNGIIVTVEHIYKKIEKKFRCNQHKGRRS